MSENKIPSLPIGWEACSFGDIVSIQNGYAFKSEHFKKSKEHETDVPLIRQSQMKGAKIDISDAVFLAEEHLKKHPNYKITKGDVIIGNDVWISSNVTIMSGVTIGDGAVIANNSHVVKNVEPYSLVGGNPARLIKYRFTQEQIEQLLEIKWWLWDDEKISAFTPLLCNSDIDEFIKACN
jgi:acetyltransferase-like isoleucine patch superfamily enzyme